MNKELKKMMVPMLRFPEFRDAADWVLLPIGGKVDLLSGYPFEGAHISDDSSGVKLLRGINITEGMIRHSNEIDRYYLGLMDKLDKYRVQTNDLVIAMDGSKVGKNVALITQSDTGALLVQRVARLRAECESTIQFIFQLVNSIRFQSYVDRINTSSGIPHISARQINDFLIYFPRIDEQQKIASCLSNIDKLIAAQSQKVDALKTHKKGLMQQLFPTDGENVPRLRFPEFLDAGDWEEKTLSQVANYENGKAHEQDIAASGRYVVVNSKFISTEGEVRKFTNSAFCIAEKNDILMVLSDIPNGRAIAKCFYVDSSNRYTVNQRICRLKPYKAVSIMLFYVLNRNSYFLAFDDGVKQTNLKKNDVLDCPILLPKDITEQQKIASCLSSIDDFINAQTQKVEALKTHKKGLMQQLFPSTEADSE